MICIGKPYIKVADGKAKVCAQIAIDRPSYKKWIAEVSRLRHYTDYEKIYKYSDEAFELWYEVDENYAPYLCTERNDAFVLAVLHFAMVTGNDITCEGDISNELFHTLNTYLIPLHCNERTGYRRIKIRGNTNPDPLQTCGENGLGISCGVDSFDTLFTYMSSDMDKEHKVSLITVFNVGAYDKLSDMILCIKGDKQEEQCRKESEEWFHFECSQGEKIAKELNLKFMAVNSNISDLYQGLFLQSHAYRNCSAALAVQKIFSHYYYASAGESKKDTSGLWEDATDTVHYFSTETVRFYLGGIEKTRIEKIQSIADSSLVQRYLHVCSEEKYNCGKCGKCGRTLIILDLINKLDEFRPNFRDSEIIDKRMWKRYLWMLDQKKSDQFAMDMYLYAKKNHVKIPLKAKLYHFTYPVRRLIKSITFFR